MSGAINDVRSEPFVDIKYFTNGAAGRIRSPGIGQPCSIIQTLTNIGMLYTFFADAAIVSI